MAVVVSTGISSFWIAGQGTTACCASHMVADEVCVFSEDNVVLRALF